MIKGIESRSREKSRAYILVTSIFKITLADGNKCSIKLDCSTPPVYMYAMYEFSFVFQLVCVTVYIYPPRDGCGRSKKVISQMWTVLADNPTDGI